MSDSPWKPLIQIKEFGSRVTATYRKHSITAFENTQFYEQKFCTHIPGPKITDVSQLSAETAVQASFLMSRVFSLSFISRVRVRISWVMISYYNNIIVRKIA